MGGSMAYREIQAGRQGRRRVPGVQVGTVESPNEGPGTGKKTEGTGWNDIQIRIGKPW